MLKTKYTVPFTTNYSDAPLIKLRQGDLEFYALVDTGSESTFIDKAFTGDMTVVQGNYKTDVTYVSFTGSSTAPYTNVQMKCLAVGESSEYPLTIDATLSDLSPIQSYFDKWTGGEVKVPVLLGSDTLIKNEAIIDFARKSFSFHDKINEEKPV